MDREKGQESTVEGGYNDLSTMYVKYNTKAKISVNNKQTPKQRTRKKNRPH
jgi:hypothetical protein